MATLLADSSMADSSAPRRDRRWLLNVGVGLGLLLLILAIGLGIKSLMSGHTSTKKAVTTIKLLPDTPPPPPPPPKEPPKEQPKDQPKEIKIEQPKQEAPPAETLKMEGAAGDGPSPFGAGKVTNDYKGGDVKIGGNKGLAAYAWYTGQIKTKIEEALAAEKQLTKAQYRLVVHVWFARDGRFERAELQGSSGDQATDDLIRKALAGISPMAEAPPEDMPQPVKLRITSKNVG